MEQLQPGDVVRSGELVACHICHLDHPLYPGLQLVIWRMTDGSWSHDALLAVQETGELDPATDAQRKERLRVALMNGKQSWA